MIGRILEFLGAVLIVLGVLKLVGVAIAIATAGAWTLIVVGVILIFAAEFLFGGGFYYSGSRARTRRGL